MSASSEGEEVKTVTQVDRKYRPKFDSGRVLFRTDHTGKDIIIRPKQFIASAEPAEVGAAIRKIVEEVHNQRCDDEVIDDGARIGGTGARRLYNLTVDRLGFDLDEIRVVRGLREQGIAAQPNHVYFVNSLGMARSSVNPNLVAGGNFFSPNLVAPNLVAPNLVAPNLVAPNLVAGGGFGAGGCCCPQGLLDDEIRFIPRLLARPVADPEPEVSIPEPAGPVTVKVHIIDVVSAEDPRDPTFDVGELDQAGHLGDGPNPTIDHNVDAWVDPAAGHGDFIKSIIKLHSGIDATLWSAADALGDIDDSHLVEALEAVDAFESEDHKVLNLSLSGYNMDDQPGTALMDQIAKMVKRGWLIVAAAGNNASCRLAWPAALPNVVAVGAVHSCGPAAWFSNYGPWVDASANGVDVVAQYPGLAAGLSVDEVEDGAILASDEFVDDGWATWSGTSFSTPIVAAKLARELQKEGSDRTTAIEAVLGGASVRVPYYGAIIT